MTLLLSTSNPRICKFYEANKSISFDAVNLIFVDLFEKLLQDTSFSVAATINSQILSSITEQSHQINDLKSSISLLKDNVSTLNTDITNSLLVKFFDIKKDYIEEVKAIVSTNTTDKISGLFEKSTNHLIDKTTLIINDIVPKSHEHFYKQIQDNIKTFHKAIREDTTSLSKNLDGNSIKEFLSNFEVKSSLMLQNIQQPIYSFIASSEDRINNNINAMKDTSNSSQLLQGKVFTELTDFMNKFRNSSYKGQFGENQLGCILNKMYSTAEIINTSGQRASGDFIMKRDKRPTIMFENKDYDRNVNPEEIKKFIRDIEEQNCHGIFLSQHTGITSKPNYFIETHNGNLLVYIHNAEYNSDRIQVAVDIIDNLAAKISEASIGSTSGGNITKEILDEINREYQSFVCQKDALSTSLKEGHKKTILQLDSLKFPSLEKYLSTKYASVQKQGYKCDLCKNFNANSLKAMAAHKRGCNRKNLLISSNPIVSEIR